MKKRSFLMAAFAAMFMASCSDNDLTQENKIIEKDTNLYMRVSIANPSGQSSRADSNPESGYEFGDPTEMNIKKILFVFYDQEENFVGYTPMEEADYKNALIKPEGSTPSNPNTKPNGTQTDLVADLVIPVSLKAGVGRPYYVMAYVNPTSSSTADQISSLAKAKTLLRTQEQITPSAAGGTNQYGFTMSNSVYYNATGNTKVSIGSIIPEGGLLDTEEDARDLKDDAKKLKIYVERLVAKVSVAQGINTETNNTVTNNGNTKYLKFKPLAWGVNNVEKYTFLIKNFRTGSTNATATEANGVITPAMTSLENLTYAEVNNAIKGTATGATAWNDWNNSNNYRSFWAYSPTYFTGGTYPSTAYDYDTEDKKKTTSLTYRSYNDFWNVKDIDSPKLGKYGQILDAKKCLYTLENTSEEEVLKNQAERALSSVVVVGQYYMVDNADANIADDATPQTFFLRRGEQNEYYSETEIRNAFIAKNSVIGKMEIPNGKTEAEFTPITSWDKATDFEIAHPGADITGTYTAPSRYVTLMLKSEIDDKKIWEKDYYYLNDNGQAVQINSEEAWKAANAKLYNVLAARNLGGIIQFTNGMAYFNVPIKHLRNTNTDGGYAAAKTGDYGVVRNHLYALTVTAIDGIGIGIRDPEDPIIVPVEEQKYFVRTELNVLAWKLVSQNNVTLKN